MIKKILASTILLFVANLALAQSIFNNGFENWTTSSYLNPQNYFTSNLQQNNGGVNPVNVIQTGNAYSNNYAVQLTTVLSGNDTAAAYVANGDPSHPVGQGIPYNQKPTGLRLYYKCDVMSGDTAAIFLMFKAGGNIISQNIQKITGTQIGYTLLTFSVNLAVTPDSLIFGALSSNIFGNGKGIPGSMLQIDSVSFTGVVSQPLLMNGDFENWQTITSNTLQNWEIEGSHNSNNSNSVQTADAHSGMYALELQTLGTNNTGDTAYSTTATTGYSTFNGTAGGYPYTQTNDSLIFYYKYVPSNPNDSAEIILQFKNAGVNFQVQSQLFKASATYIRAAMAISLMQTPDSVIVSINSSKNWSVPPSYLGADLKIDDIYFKSQPPMLGAALNFDGVDDVVRIPSSLSQQFQNNQITVEGWFYPTAYASASNPVPALITENFYGDGNVQFDMHLDGPDSLLVGGFFDGSWHSISTHFNLNQWQHYACTYDQQNLVLYINGVQMATMPLTNPLPVGGDGWHIGQRWDNPDYFQGSMDEVRIWNRALCAAEIQNNMNAEIDEHSNGLVAYFKFNQGIGNNNNSTVSTLTDSTGNGFNGTLDGFSLMGTTSNFVTPSAVTTGSMVPAFISTVATQTNVACHGNANGTASVAVSGAAAPFTYSWSSGAGTGPAQGSLLAGNYTCTINYACGTTAQTFTITEPAQLMASSASGTIACNGGATTVSVTATGGTPTYSNTGTFSVTANSYTYTVTDANNCTATTIITITQPNAITTILSPTLCVGSSIMVGPHTYSTVGTYTDVLTAHNGCDSTVTTNLTVNQLAAAFSYTLSSANNQVFFQDSSYYSSGNSVSTYSWSVAGGGQPVQTYTVPNPVVNIIYPNTIVCLKVTSVNGCTDSICKSISQIFTGINQYGNIPVLTVYPNPAQNNFTIETKSAEKQTLNMFDVNGKLVLSQNINGTTNINTETLAPGAYNISLISNYGVTNKRLIIVK